MSIYCYLCPTEYDALFSLTCFVEVCKEKVCDYNRPNRWVLCKNGDELHFVSASRYKEWCRGRTYFLDHELYHSGMLLKGEQNGNR